MSGLDIMNDLRGHFRDAGFIISKIYPKGQFDDLTTINVRHKISKKVSMMLNFQVSENELFIEESHDKKINTSISLKNDNISAKIANFCNSLFDNLIQEENPDDRLDEFDTTTKRMQVE